MSQAQAWNEYWSGSATGAPAAVRAASAGRALQTHWRNWFGALIEERPQAVVLDAGCGAGVVSAKVEASEPLHLVLFRCVKGERSTSEPK